MKKHNPPVRHPKTPSPPTMHVRLSAEMWLDVFLEHYSALLMDEDNKDMTMGVARDIAHDRADVALEAYERRWPNIKLLGNL